MEVPEEREDDIEHELFMKFILPWHIIRKRELRSWVQNLVLVSTVGSLLSSLSIRVHESSACAWIRKVRLWNRMPMFLF